jgi:hypothetical protein
VALAQEPLSLLPAEGLAVVATASCGAACPRGESPLLGVEISPSGADRIQTKQHFQKALRPIALSAAWAITLARQLRIQFGSQCGCFEEMGTCRAELPACWLAYGLERMRWRNCRDQP